jgi:hypothetical protein
MAKKKKNEPSSEDQQILEDKSVDVLSQCLHDYLEICGNTAKVSMLEKKYTSEEIQLFVHEIKTQKAAIDTDNLFDISVLEQLADLHIQEMKNSLVPCNLRPSN